MPEIGKRGKSRAGDRGTEGQGRGEASSVVSGDRATRSRQKAPRPSDSARQGSPED